MVRTRMLYLSIMIVVILVSLCTSVAVAAPPSYAIQIDRTSATVGETVTLTVSGSELSDVYGYEAVVTFDPNKVMFESARNVLPKGSSNESNGFSIAPLIDRNQVTFAYTKVGRIPGASGEVALANFTFKAKQTGNVSFGLSSIKIVHSDLSSEKPSVNQTVRTVVRPIESGNGEQSSDGQTPGRGNPQSGPDNGEKPNRGITVTRSVNTAGTVQARLTPGELSQAQVSEDGRLHVKLQSDSIQAIRNVEIRIPLQSLLDRDQSIKEIMIDTGLAIATISVNEASGLFDANAQNMDLNMYTVDPASLGEGVRALVGNAPVLDFELWIDDQPITEFKNHPIQIQIPYVLGQNENPNKVVIYYISDDGELEAVKNARYDPGTGTVGFMPHHFSQYAPVYSTVTFNDLATVDWAIESVEALAAREIVSGTGDGAFEPDRLVSRAEFVHMLVQSLDLAVDGTHGRFSDVEPGAWYADSIATAERLGIVHGKSDGSFGAQDSITREDMAVLVHRAATALDIELARTDAVSFTDSASISAYAVEAVHAMQSSGLILGMDDGTFQPGSYASRAQAAVMMYRLFASQR